MTPEEFKTIFAKEFPLIYKYGKIFFFPKKELLVKN